MFEKIASPKDSNPLHSVFITGQSITSKNKVMNIQQKFKIVSNVPIGTGRISWKKKPETKNIMTLFL
jgi:hypothetical protein